MNKTESLAERILVAMYGNPGIEPEDCVHNAKVALGAARALQKLTGDGSVVIADDGRCTCDGSSFCPLRKTGSALRCTEAELVLAGVPVIHE